jgi:xanthine dehydrogenase accessory factor
MERLRTMSIEDRKQLVVVKGGGELGTGVAYRLFKEGFQIIITEVEKPKAERRTVSFAEAVYKGEHTVEGVTAKLAKTPEECLKILSKGKIALIVDPEASIIKELKPAIVVDARMAKRNLGTKIDEAAIVIGLGPGFKAKHDTRAVIETKPGVEMGKIIFDGEALPNNGVPYSYFGYTFERLLVAPASGKFKAVKRIGDKVKAGETVGLVEETPVVSRISGVIFGLIHDGVEVKAGKKIGDVIPEKAAIEEKELAKLKGKPAESYLYTMTERTRIIAESVLKAIQILSQKNKL